MWPLTPAGRQHLAYRCRTCCLRANENPQPLRCLIFRGSIPHPMQSLCTLRNHCRQWPRNTRYQADATPYLGRTSTGWIAPALPGARSGRDVHFMARPPAQIRTCGFPAYGSCLGCVTAQVAVYAPAPVTREPGSESSTCFAGAVFPLAPALRSTDSAATAPADASAGSFPRFVRRLHSYYDEVRLLVSVHHRLRLLTFPMRTVPLTQHLTARPETSQVPMRSLCT